MTQLKTLLSICNISQEEFLQVSHYLQEEFDSWTEETTPKQAYVIGQMISLIAHMQPKLKTIIHITAGDENWIPTLAELNVLVKQFLAAEIDPEGGILSTRAPVSVTSINVGEVQSIAAVLNKDAQRIQDLLDASKSYDDSPESLGDN